MPHGSGIAVEDLTARPTTGRDGLHARNARTDARRGSYVLRCTSRAWSVCSLCGLPCVEWPGLGSACCSALVRFQGWSS